MYRASSNTVVNLQTSRLESCVKSAKLTLWSRSCKSKEGIDDLRTPQKARKLSGRAKKMGEITSPGHFRRLAVRSRSHDCGGSLLSMAMLKIVLGFKASATFDFRAVNVQVR